MAAEQIAGMPLVTPIVIGDIHARTDWRNALAGCDSIVHLAGRAHVAASKVGDAGRAFDETNVEGTLNLARQAVSAGVKRFVFVSSVGVHGRQSLHAFTENDPPMPVDAYAVSKLRAEHALRQMAAGSNMELVIVRPPLVYGPGCPGNFLRLLKLVSLRVPLPFGSIWNRRSFIGVWNLASFLAASAMHTKAANQIFLVSDAEDIALPDLLKLLAEGMHVKLRLLRVDPRLMASLSRMLGVADTYEKLCGSLTIDSAHARSMLGWVPPVSLRDGLMRTGEWYARQYLR